MENKLTASKNDVRGRKIAAAVADVIADNCSFLQTPAGSAALRETHHRFRAS